MRQICTEGRDYCDRTPKIQARRSWNRKTVNFLSTNVRRNQRNSEKWHERVWRMEFRCKQTSQRWSRLHLSSISCCLTSLTQFAANTLCPAERMSAAPSGSGQPSGSRILQGRDRRAIIWWESLTGQKTFGSGGKQTKKENFSNHFCCLN